MTSPFKVLPRPADEDEWLEMRKPYSNASSAAVHMRAHEYESIADWFVAKRTGATKEETRAMTRGKELEAAIGGWYARENGLIISPLDVVFVRGRLMATPDFDVIARAPHFDHDANAVRLDKMPVREGLEVKGSPGKRGQRSRYWQCIGLLAASDWDAVHLVELHSGDYKPTYLARSDPNVAADIERLMAAIDADWSWLDQGLPPPDAVFDADQAFKVWTVPGIAKVELDASQAAAAVELKAARAAEKKAKARAEAARNVLADAMRDAEIATYLGEPIVSWKANRPSQVEDWEGVRRTVPDVVARFTSEKAGNRQMRVIGEPPAAPTEDEVGF